MRITGTIKKISLIAAGWVVAVVVLCTPVEAAGQRLKAKLGCVPLVARTIEAMGTTEYLTTLLLNELERGGWFEVAERKRLEAALDQEGVRSDSLSSVELQRLGARLGVEYLVSGSVTTQPQGMLLEFSVLDLRSQRVVLTEKQHLSEADATRSLQELALRIRQAAQRSTETATGPELAKPLAPATAVEAVGSTNAIRLHWRHASPERVVGYMILRSTEPQGPFTTVGTVTESVYSDEQLRLNETYYYRVTAVGRDGMVSEPTEVVQGATSVAPAVPIFMNVEPVLGGAILSWRQRPGSVSDERALPKGVRIYRRSAAEKESLPITRVADDQSGYRDHGLQDGTTYLYTMTAYNQAGAESEQSVQLSLITPPKIAGATAGSGKVRRIPVSWQVHPLGGVSGYTLQRAIAKEGPYQVIATLNDRQQTSYLDTGLTDKTTYWYRIVAFSKELGTGGPSDEVSATTRDLPPVPLNLSALQGEPRRVTLAWDSTTVPDDELLGFYLYRGEPGQEKLARIAELAPDQRAYRDDKEQLKDGTAYSYVIASFNAGGAVSPLSARANSVTKALPKPVEGLQLKDRATRLISWQTHNQPDVKRYNVYKKGFMGVQKLVTVEATEWRSTESGKLELHVTAEDSDGLESEPSAVLTVE